MKQITTLTKAEEQIMQELWELGEGNVNDIIDRLPEPKPAYNTVSTIVRILEKKSFVDHKSKGRGYIYFPMIDRETYSQFTAQKLAESYFEGSFKNMVSFFVKQEKVGLEELQEIINKLND
jgi:predicted transcriptional regulator